MFTQEIAITHANYGDIVAMIANHVFGQHQAYPLTIKTTGPIVNSVQVEPISDEIQQKLLQSPQHHRMTQLLRKKHEYA